MKINVGIFEGYIRLIVGVSLVALGSHVLWYLLIPMGILLLYTGATSKCPINKALHIESEAARQNLYLSYLPRYNPEPVFIFDIIGNLTFSNKPANTQFPTVSTFSQFTNEHKDDLSSIISEERVITTSLTNDNRFYSIIMRGSTEVQGVVVYATDATTQFELDLEIIETQKEIVVTMGEIGETRSKETGHHVRRVAEYSQLLAEKHGLSSADSDLLRMASPMHDIGKVGIPDSVLLKPGKLTAEEFELMKAHATLGYDMLKHSTRPILKAAATVAIEHHEKWNGKGYPNGLKGEEIHIYGRITAIADVFDALGSDRVYKKAWPLEKILSLIEEERGEHFDPKLVDIFLENLDQFIEIRDRFVDDTAEQ